MLSSALWISEPFLPYETWSIKQSMSSWVVTGLSLDFGSDVAADAYDKLLYRRSKLNILRELTLQFLSCWINPAAECAAAACWLPTAGCHQTNAHALQKQICLHKSPGLWFQQWSLARNKLQRFHHTGRRRI